MPVHGVALRVAVFFVTALCAMAWLGALGARDLAKTDEGRYAEIPREMVASGDWLTPRLDGLKYFEKPALQYWATALAYESLGISGWASRLWAGLCSLVGVFAVGYTGLRLFGARTGVFAAAVLASSLLYLLMGHVDTLDMGLTFFMGAGLCAALLARAADTGRAARHWMLAAWAAFALAVLSKGLIGIVLPGAVLVLYLGLARDWVLLKRIEPWRGPLLFFALCAPWFIAVSEANPGFARFFFYHEHVERFLSNSHHREGPWWYFVPVLALGSLPWLTWLPGALWHAVRATPTRLPGVASAPTGAPVERFAPEFLLALWCGFIFLFFSVSSSKLPSYILPIFPALALLIARHIDRTEARALRWHASVLIVAALAFGVLALNAGALAPAHSPPDPEQLLAYAGFGRWLTGAALLWLTGSLGLWLLSRRNADAGVLALACGALLGGLVGLAGYASLDRYASAHYVARALEGRVDAHTALYSIEMYDQTLPFYLGRTLTLVNERDELEYGLTEEPAKGVPTLEAFAERWRADASALAIMPPTTYPRLVAMNLPMRVILKDSRFVVVSKP